MSVASAELHLMAAHQMQSFQEMTALWSGESATTPFTCSALTNGCPLLATTRNAHFAAGHGNSRLLLPASWMKADDHIRNFRYLAYSIDHMSSIDSHLQPHVELIAYAMQQM